MSTAFPPPPVPFDLPYPNARLCWALDVIGWTQRELSRRVHVGERTARDWCSGRRPIPDDLARWIETLAAVVMSLPLPFNWRPPAEAVPLDEIA